MNSIIQWPDLKFPPINLYNAPKQTLPTEGRGTPEYHQRNGGYAYAFRFRQTEVQATIRALLNGAR